MKPVRIEPGPEQESVWDYPRPPLIEESKRAVRIVFAGEDIVRSTRALRVLETAGPPTYYVLTEDVLVDCLVPVDRTTVCEWKGEASYFDIELKGQTSRRAAWHYPNPYPGYEKLNGYVAFYPGRVDAAYLDDEVVKPQAGGFYGGWITEDIVGPFKGDPGSENW